MFRKSAVVALGLVLAATAPAVARTRAIDVATLPVGPAPRVTYQSGTTVHAPDGRVVNIPQDTYGSGLIGQVGARYLIQNGGRQGTYFTLLDQAGNSTQTGPVITVGSYNFSRIDGAYAVFHQGGGNRAPDPALFVDLATGTSHAFTLRRGVRPHFLHVGPEGATYTFYKPRSSKGKVRLVRPDGTSRTLFTVRGGRTPFYANIATGVVLASGSRGLTVSTVRKPNRVRWVAKGQQAISLSPDSTRILVRGRSKKDHDTLAVRRLSDGKVLGRYTFTTNTVARAGVFEDPDSFITVVRDRPGDGEAAYEPVFVRCHVGGGCERLPGSYGIPDADPIR